MSAHVGIGKIDPNKPDGMAETRAMLASRIALLPTGENPALGGGNMVVPRTYDVEHLEFLLILEEDDVRPATVHAWPIRDKASLASLGGSLRGGEKEYVTDRLRDIDPASPDQILYAVGREPGRALGYLHAERSLTLDGNPGAPEIGYWLKLQTMYLGPMERGRRTSYGFVALADDIVRQEIEAIIEKAKPVLGPMEVNIFVSAEVEAIPDNRVMRRMDATFEVLGDLLRTDHPDVKFDVSVDHDNVPITMATQR